MFRASCILLWLAVASTHQHIFTYVKPWNPFRRSIAECEMCYKGDCVLTDGPRCEYYSDASKLLSDDGSEDDEKVEEEVHKDNDQMEHEVYGGNDKNYHQKDDNIERENRSVKIDKLLFELVDSASSAPQFKACIPLVSQYTDCTEENICTGCNFCSCNGEGKWVCIEKQKCRPEPKLKVDHRIVGVVIGNLKRKLKRRDRREKRSAIVNTMPKNNKDKLTYSDISKWMYGVEPLNLQNKFDVGEVLKHLETNETSLYEYKVPVTPIGPVFVTDKSTNKSDNYVDLIEFNDILQSWTNEPFTDSSKTVARHHYSKFHVNDVDYSEYDPIRLIKRDTSHLGANVRPAILQKNTTNTNFTYELIFTDALQGLNKITNEKQKELDELLNIQSSLLTIAKAHNIAVDINSTIDSDNYNRHHIAIYKLNTFEKCAEKVKHDICSAIANVIKTEPMSNSSDVQRDLKLIFRTIKKYLVNEKAIEYDQNPRKHFEPDNTFQYSNPIKHMGNILTEINKTLGNPLRSLSQQSQKILKRVIKQLYLDDFAVIDYIVHETYYDFDSYMNNIGTKWNKMMQDVIDSNIFDTLYRVKILHMTLKADISKMEDMITLLDFARNRRMTVANGLTIDKSILRIQNNLQLIDSNVQKIMELEKSKRTRQATAVKRAKSGKKNSILQKLKKIFQSSKNDIKKMLRKRFPKSEIMKRIAKKKIDELETRKMLDYQETMKQWQENLSNIPAREKRAAWGLQGLADHIKNIIPGYLRGKVNPALHRKKINRTQSAIREGRNKRHSKPTTIKTSTVSRNLTES